MHVIYRLDDKLSELVTGIMQWKRSIFFIYSLRTN